MRRCTIKVRCLGPSFFLGFFCLGFLKKKAYNRRHFSSVYVHVNLSEISILKRWILFLFFYLGALRHINGWSSSQSPKSCPVFTEFTEGRGLCLTVILQPTARTVHFSQLWFKIKRYIRFRIQWPTHGVLGFIINKHCICSLSCFIPTSTHQLVLLILFYFLAVVIFPVKSVSCIFLVCRFC